MAKKSNRTKKMVSFTNTEAQNAAKTLLANIRFLSVDDPLRSIVLTSSVPNEGKTITSVYLAHAIATAGYKVLLVDADMRKRSLARLLGVQSRAGLYSVLSGSIPLRAAIVNVDIGNGQAMGFLDVEPGIPNPPDILASRRFGGFLDMALASYDFVLFDTPPVGTFVDAAVLSASADATILIVRPNEVKRETLQNSYDQLQKAGANIIGAVATFVEDKKSGYYYAYYNGEGKRVKSSNAATTQPPLPPMQVSSTSRSASTPSSGYQLVRTQGGVPENQGLTDQRQAKSGGNAAKKTSSNQAQDPQRNQKKSPNHYESAPSAAVSASLSAHASTRDRTTRRE